MQHHVNALSYGRLSSDRPSAQPRILDVIPENAGPRVTTFRGGAVHSVRPAGSQTFVSDMHFAAVMLAPLSGITASFGSDKPQTYDAPLGMIVVSPAFVESRSSWSARRENIAVAITPESMIELAESEFGGSAWDLQPPPFGTVDLKALQLAQLLKAELTRAEPPNELMVDSLITIFGIHLLRNYTGRAVPPSRKKGGLPVATARRVQNYLRENFARKLSVTELAAVCDLSAGHFIQAFTRAVQVVSESEGIPISEVL
ncbi:AraC family transcriptional regulator [Chelativorans sp. AA-79]|uniref:AraC family transcriptional regulator n=1 Tax=Chelativorans sp. AA-79 TaxID=3028735 RepID=UPI0023F87A10|nr:AraC family transcriptional regulator [Chelativorans sp. AA-79]WEX09533.1 AraC family transcriptional regulator [Chelativorans sp. AA-79]